MFIPMSRLLLLCTIRYVKRTIPLLTSTRHECRRIVILRLDANYVKTMLWCWSSTYSYGKLGGFYDYVICHPTTMVGWANVMMTRDVLEYMFYFALGESDFAYVPCIDSVMGCVGIMQSNYIYDVYIWIFVWRSYRARAHEYPEVSPGEVHLLCELNLV